MGLLSLVCFFLSGASGLVFEVVWTRQLGLVFGATTLAIATVLAVFMGGLALGSLIAGRHADRIEDPLRAYALVEGGVGLYGLLIPYLLGYYPGLNTLLHGLVGEHRLGLSLLRFVATALLLLPPTTLMGATLPLLSRHLVARAGDFERLGVRIGNLYGANTLGAVVGAFLAGFVLLPALGVRATNATACFTNLALTAAVLLARAILRRRRERAPDGLDDPSTFIEPARSTAATSPATEHVLATDGRDARSDELRATEDPLPSGDGALSSDELAAPEAAPPLAITPLQRRVALYSFGVSGAAAMIYQVLWSRALAIVIGSSVYSFTLILLAFLIGLSVGASLWSRLSARSTRPVAWLAATHTGAVAMVVVSYLLLDKLPGAFLGMLRGGAFTVDEILFSQFLLAALPVLPATLFLGGVLPLTLRIYTSGLERVGRDVGDAYSMNTLGAITGSFAAGFVVLPLLGLQRGLFGAAICSSLVAATLLLVAEGRRRPRIIAACATVALTLSAGAFLPKWDLGHFQAGLFRVALAKQVIESGKWLVPQLLYYRDGISTTVSLESWGKHLALKNNGKVDASNGDDMPTQVMVGLMPFLFHPTALERPPRVAVIGYGSGVTVGAATQFPIQHADVVELEPAVIEAARWFGGHFPPFTDVNHRPDENPKVRLIIDDGRNFLGQKKGDPYDVIISEPSNPWITGVSNLFTRDYWTMARDRLADDGVFCQWAQLYELSPRNIKTILKTFSGVFPYTYVFSAEDLSSDLILVAAKHPISLDRARLARNFEVESVRTELARADVRSPDDLLAYLLLTPEEIPAFTAGSDENSDDNALIEFSAPRDLLGYMRYDPYLARVYGADWPYGRIERHLRGLGEGPARGSAEAHIAESLVAHGKRGAALRFVGHAQRHQGGAQAAYAARLVDLLGQRKSEDPEQPLDSDEDPLDPPQIPKGLAEAQVEQLGRDYAVAEAELGKHRYAHALKAMGAWPERWIEEGGKDLSLVLGYLLYKAEIEDDAVDRLRPLAADAAYVKRRPSVLYYLARSFYGEALYAAGVREMKRFLDAEAKPASAAAAALADPPSAEKATPSEKVPSPERATPVQKAPGAK